jgi:ABC-2 type transport system ATP-binding protein
MDPQGRDEMLELVHDLGHNKGVNLILSSHLLPDVEYACDHVVVLDKGKVAAAGPIAALKQPRGRVFELRVEAAGRRSRGVSRHPRWRRLGVRDRRNVMRVFVPGEGGARDLFAIAASAGAQVRHLRPSVPTLEDVFARRSGRTEARCRFTIKVTGAIWGRGYREAARGPSSRRPACARSSGGAPSLACS